MIEFNPKALVTCLNGINSNRFDPEIHHTVAVLAVFGDAGFMARGDSDQLSSDCASEGKITFNELTLFHPDVKNIWFRWILDDGEIEVLEGPHPDTSDELVEIDINEFISIAVEDDLLLWIKEMLGEIEVKKEGRSWAELVDALQELEIHSDEEDVEALEAVITKLETKHYND